MIKNIFALAVGLQVAGGNAFDIAALVFADDMLAQPTSSPYGGAAFLQCPEEFMRNKRIVARGVGASIPGVFWYIENT